MTRGFTLTPTVARDVLAHALDAVPDECCGILLGPAPRHATEVRPTKNVHESPRTRYRVDPEQLIATLDEADRRALVIVGFYHSHPRGAAAFSNEDRARGSWEGAAYLLLSLQPFAWLAGEWDGQDFVALEVLVA